MNMVKKSLNAFIGAAALALATTASYATPVIFNLADSPESSVKITNLDKTCILGNCGVTASLNPVLDNLEFELSAGETVGFDFFSLNFYGLGAGSGNITANLGFDLPSDAQVVTGSGSGSFLSAFIFSAGSLNWTTQPAAVTLANGTSYTVKFQDLFGIKLGDTVNVRALLTLNSEPTSVPEPGTLALLGLGLLGTGLAKKMRRKAA